MIADFIDLLFGCSHSNYTFPITSKPGERRSDAAAVTGTYVVCLDCGKEFPYDWKQMKVMPRRPPVPSRPAEAAATADLKAA